MMPFLTGISRNKSRVTIAGIIAAILVVVLLGLFWFRSQSESRLSWESAQETTLATNLGITYLPVTPVVSAYYRLGVDAGALVTEVVPDSLADRAGVQIGDVILSYNGTILEEGVPLLGMMMACPVDHNVMLEIWREEGSRVIQFVHTSSR